MEVNLQLFFFQCATQMTFQTICNRKVRFLDVGSWNLYAGPDFKMVRYNLDGIDCIGDVEIHLRASDWIRHRHHLDATYNQVHIHFVGDCDTIIGHRMLHIQVPNNWRDCVLKRTDVRNPKTFDLEIKRTRLQNWIANFGIEHAAFVHLARALGRHVQGDAMQGLATQLIPFVRNQDCHAQDYAALFHGLAGQLEDNLELDFYVRWKSIFFELCPNPDLKIHWNNKVNFPSRQWLKVSQLLHLHLLAQGVGYRKLLNSPELFRSLMSEVCGMNYWESHYRFGQKLPYKTSTNLSKNAQEGIFMNTIPIWELAFEQ